MKKWALLLLLFCSFVFSGCVEEPEEEIKPTEVIITGAKTSIDLNETVQLSAVVKPDQAKKDVVWASKNTEIVTVDQSGKIKGVGEGTTEIICVAKSDSKIKDSITVTVINPIQYADPISIAITGRATMIYTGSQTTLTATVSPFEASQEVIWTSSDDSIATVIDGVVKGLTVGEVTITATVVADNTLTAVYTIQVEQFNGTSPKEPTDVVVQGANSVVVGKTTTLVASVLPAGVSQNVVWSSSEEDIAVVNSQGVVTGLKEGVTYITAASAIDTSKTYMHKMTVKYFGSDEKYPDMGGYQIKIMGAGHALNEHNPFMDDYPGLDKQAKQEAWLYVEEQFNCDFEVVAFPTEAPWGSARYNWLNEKAALNAAETDIFVSTTEWLKVLAEGNSIVDTTEYYEYYGESSMNVALKSSTTYKEKLYGLPVAGVGVINVDKGLFYNFGLLNTLGLESPAKHFNEGNWTYEDFEAYVRAAAGLMGEGQTVLSGKPAYFYMGMVNAAGVKLADTVTMDMNFDHPYAVETASLLRELYEEIGWGTIAWDALCTTFNNGDSLFQAAEWWFVRTANRFPKDLWGENTKYGFVPYPYPNEMEKEDTRTVGFGGACYMQAKGRQYAPGVTEKDVYRAFTTMMLKTSELMLEDAEYDEETIMRRAASAKLDDPESVTAAVFFTRDKIVFDPLYGLIDVHSNIGSSIDSVVVSGSDYFEVMNTLEPLYQNAMEDIYS